MKWKIAFSIAILVLGGFTWWLLRGNNSGKIRKELVLHISDTSSIYQIDILDRNGDQITLQREKSQWLVNGEPARQHAVQNLLGTIQRQRVSALIPTTALDQVVRDLSSNGVRFDVKGKNGQSLLVFYVGGVTPDERGTFMIREDSEWPVIVNIPGFEGSLRSRYIMPEYDWKSRKLMEPVRSLQKVIVDYPTMQDHSFELTKDASGYHMKPLYDHGAERIIVHPYLVEAYRDLLNNLHAEALLDDQKRPMLDVAIPFCIVTVTDETGNTQKLEFYPTAWIDYQEEGALEQQVERYYTDKNDESIFLTQHLLMQKVFTGYEHFVSLKDFGTQ